MLNVLCTWLLFKRSTTQLLVDMDGRNTQTILIFRPQSRGASSLIGFPEKNLKNVVQILRDKCLSRSPLFDAIWSLSPLRHKAPNQQQILSYFRNETSGIKVSASKAPISMQYYWKGHGSDEISTTSDSNWDTYSVGGEGGGGQDTEDPSRIIRRQINGLLIPSATV